MYAPIVIGDQTYPLAMVEAVAAEAVRSADRVITFLDAAGLSASPDHPLHLPPEFLLTVGAGLQFLLWEINGYTVHLDAGLLAAKDVIHNAFRAVKDRATFDSRLPVRVLGLYVDHFCWRARAELGAEILLDNLDPDVMAEAVAQFLWAARHQLPGSNPHSSEN
jgi:hypothetical protein